MRSETGNANSRYGRLKAFGAGLILAAVGILRMLGGVQVVTHWTRHAWDDVTKSFDTLASRLKLPSMVRGIP